MTTKVAPLPNLNLSEIIPASKRIWEFCLAVGTGLWGIGIILWLQQGIDETVLFYYNDARIAHGPGMVLQEWLSSSGLAILSSIYLLYLLGSYFIPRLDVSKTIFLYTICSYGISSVAGDLIKEVIARPRPLVTYGSEIYVLSQAVTPAMPSGHATKSIALVIPFILLVSNKDNLHRILKVIMLVLAGGVCVSRIVLGAHYVSDVIAGIGMGIIGLPFTMLFAKMILKRMRTEQLPVLSLVWGGLLIFLTIVFILK